MKVFRIWLFAAICLLNFSAAEVLAQSQGEVLTDQLIDDYLAHSKSTMMKMLKDYEIAAEVFYDLKRRSAHPDTFIGADGTYSDKKLHELNLPNVKEFKEAMSAVPKLNDNLFLKLLYDANTPTYSANDAIQRLTGEIDRSYVAALAEPIRKQLRLTVGINVMYTGLHYAHGYFKRVSARSGYPQNGTSVDTEHLKLANQMLDDGVKALKAKAIPAANLVRHPPTGGNAACGPTFSQLGVAGERLLKSTLD